MKIAVIGAGPAAAGVCLGLTEADANREHDITVFDIGKQMSDMAESVAGVSPRWDKGVYHRLHREIRNAGTGWIPEKSHFGEIPGKYPGTPVFRSDMFGGLSKFWGASFVPFIEENMRDWPFGEKELSVYYRKLLDHIRITGALDRMNSYFSADWFNERPIQVPAVMSRLEQAINSSPSSRFIAGTPRLALSNSGLNGCTYCGHCFYGCYNGSIYTADQTIRELIGRKLVRYAAGKQMLRFSKASGIVEIDLKDTGTGEIESLRFDKVYLAAGCLETTRIISNSLCIKQFPIVENPMFQVPIIYTGRAKSKEFTELLALHNVLIGRLPGEEIDSYVHMQVYPLNLYLWNHALSKMMGNVGLSMSDLAQRTVGKHVYMMLFYFHGDLTRGSSVQFDGEEMNLQFRYESGLNHQAKQVLRELSGVLQRSGFHVGTPFMSQLPPGGSYHYAATVPAVGTDYADASLCELVKGVHVCDSASFPSLPAQNHSYTIMANAYRIADQSLT